MNSFEIIKKYFKLINEEKNFNYKYNPILNTRKKKHLYSNKISDINNRIDIKKIKILSPTEEKCNLGQENKKKNIKKLEKIDSNADETTQNKKICKTENKNSKIENRKIIHFEKIMNNKSVPFKNIKIFNENDYIKHFIDYKELQQKKQENIKGFLIRSHCPFCQKIITEKENNKEDKNIYCELNNIYRNKNFKDIKSCFIYSVNNFPLINSNNVNLNKNFSKEKIFYEENDKFYRTQKIKNKKYNMESELTKKNKIVKFKEIQRKEIDPTNLYIIKKPLIPSIRGKIFKNTKKRFEKPKRMIFLDDREIEPFDEIIINNI